jgi:hypothetical protein
MSAAITVKVAARPDEVEDRPREPRTAAELVEVLDDMRTVLGPPEAMESPRARAIYLLNQSRLTAAGRYEKEGAPS